MSAKAAKILGVGVGAGIAAAGLGLSRSASRRSRQGKDNIIPGFRRRRLTMPQLKKTTT